MNSSERLLSRANSTQRLQLKGVVPIDSYQFRVIHISAVVALVISIGASIYTLVYLRRNEKGSFYKWKMGQRMVLYLAVTDLFLSIPHPLDHIYSLFHIEAAYEELCKVLGLVLQTGGLAQGILVSFIAGSAFITVFFNKRISFGRYDWALVLTTIGVPITVGIVMAGLDWFGPSGYWCHADIRKKSGLTVHTVCSAVLVAAFIANLLGYLGVWAAVVSSSKRMGKYQDKQTGDTQKYNKTARILVLFVLAFLAQWFAYVTYTIWSYFDEPHWILVEVVVLTVNMGGVFNFIAYTFVRRKNNEAKDTQKSSSLSTISDGRHHLPSEVRRSGFSSKQTQQQN